MTEETATPELPQETPTAKTPMSDTHKAALAVGRMQGATIRKYLEAVKAHQPKRGRKVTPDQLRDRIAKTNESIVSATQIARLGLIQERIDLEAALAASAETNDLVDLEREFVKVAKFYAERKNFSYRAFREAGVPPAVLKEAGIVRSN